MRKLVDRIKASNFFVLLRLLQATKCRHHNLLYLSYCTFSCSMFIRHDFAIRIIHVPFTVDYTAVVIIKRAKFFKHYENSSDKITMDFHLLTLTTHSKNAWIPKIAIKKISIFFCCCWTILSSTQCTHCPQNSNELKVIHKMCIEP